MRTLRDVQSIFRNFLIAQGGSEFNSSKSSTNRNANLERSLARLKRHSLGFLLWGCGEVPQIRGSIFRVIRVFGATAANLDKSKDGVATTTNELDGRHTRYITLRL